MKTTGVCVLAMALSCGLSLLAGCSTAVAPAQPAAGSEPAVAQPAASAPAAVNYAGSPYLGELRNKVLYGEIWERPQLSKRDRSLITIAVLQALAREELRGHIERGLNNGLTGEEIAEIILHTTFYAGWPTGVQASGMAAEVFKQRGITLAKPTEAGSYPKPAKRNYTEGAYAVVPRLGELRDSLIYGDVWERPQLSKRDRSLMTVAVAQALYVTNELRGHIRRALDENGVTPQHLSETILHVAFYAGWPTAVNAGGLAAEAYKERKVVIEQLQ